MVHPYNGILLWNKKKQSTDTYNTGKYQMHCGQWKKLVSVGYICVTPLLWHSIKIKIIETD